MNRIENEIKQDREIKTFERLAGKIKKIFRRLPICILADGLYVKHKVIDVCKENQWDYMIRYKEGSASSIAEEYRSLPEVKHVDAELEYGNETIFGNDTVNLVYYRETKEEHGEKKRTEFSFITNITITAEKAKDCQCRKKTLENREPEVQPSKKLAECITHACSWNENTQKNHYLMEQIADFMKQVYEYFYLNRNGIKKTQKKYIF